MYISQKPQNYITHIIIITIFLLFLFFCKMFLIKKEDSNVKLFYYCIKSNPIMQILSYEKNLKSFTMNKNYSKLTIVLWILPLRGHAAFENYRCSYKYQN